MNFEVFYNATYAYLLDKAKAHNISQAELEKYFVPETGNGEFFRTYAQKNLNNLLFRFAFHSQNSSQVRKIIKFPTEIHDIQQQVRLRKFQAFFCDFDPHRLLNQYTDVQALFADFITEFGFPETSSLSKTGDYKRGVPYKYCRSVYTAAALLAQYKDYAAFIKKLRSCGDMAPIYISFEVYGLSVALACDFIKELPEKGFDLPKPDTHILEVLFALGYLEKKDGDIAKYQAIKQFRELVAELKKVDSKMTSYKLDKMLWLICSETFYNHDNIPNNTDTKRKAYIQYIQNALSVV